MKLCRSAMGELRALPKALIGGQPWKWLDGTCGTERTLAVVARSLLLSAAVFLAANLATEKTMGKRRYFALLLTSSYARDGSMQFPEKKVADLGLIHRTAVYVKHFHTRDIDRVEDCVVNGEKYSVCRQTL